MTTTFARNSFIALIAVLTFGAAGPAMAQDPDPIEELRQQIAVLTLATKQLQTRVTALETGNVALGQRMTAAEARVTTAETRLAATEFKLQFVTTSADGRDIVIEGANLHVRNGSGATSGAVNGYGNLVLGYNEALMAYPYYDRAGFGVEKEGPSQRTGSHNLVIGDGHSYTSYAGVVTGQASRITKPYASVTGGVLHLSSGFATTISGGRQNQARGDSASVTGGSGNLADGFNASVNGGVNNRAAGGAAAVAGGQSNTASGVESTVLGGSINQARGPRATVAGGAWNSVDGQYAMICGGLANRISAPANFASILGGQTTSADHPSSTVLGGRSTFTDQQFDIAPF